MSNEWPVYKIDELKAPRPGSIAIGPFGSRMKSDTYVPAGVPVIRGNNFSDTRAFVGDFVYIPLALAEEMPNCNVFEGDLVFPHRGNIGTVAYVAREQPRYMLSTSLMKLTCDCKKVDPLWLFYFFRSATGKHELLKNASQVGTPGIATPLASLRSIPVQLAPLAVQHRVARILGSLDDKIDLNRRMNETLEAMARSVFRSWFVDFDPLRAKADGRTPVGMDAATAALFPKRFEDSQLGPIPAGWKVRPLVELTSKIGSGATPRGGSDVYVDQGVAFIRSQNVYDHKFEWDGLVRITDDAAEDLKGVTVQEGDILLNITGDSILRTCVVDPSVVPARVSQHVAIIRPADTLPVRFLHLYLVHPSMKAFLLGHDTGATRKAITKGHLESVPVLQPSSPVLNRFRDLTSPIFQRIESNSAESRTLATIRDALLPRLLSGELRVPEAEAIIGAAT